MGFKSVFRSLQDVFPQVDIRILKAAAIEHSKDADAAVEFILFEVLPSICHSETPHIPVDVPVVYGDKVQHMDNVVNSTHLNGLQDGSLLEIVESVHSSDHESLKDGTEEPSFSEINRFATSGSFVGSSALKMKDKVDSSPHDKVQDLNQPAPDDSGSFIYNDCMQEKSSLNTHSNEAENVAANLLLLHNESSIFEDSQEFTDIPKKETTSSVCESIELNSVAPLGNTSEEVAIHNQIVDVVDHSSTGTVVARSNEACRTDLLEDAINEAKNNKTTLFSSMESVISMMREVELQEKAAEQTKAEALKGGLHTIAKAGDIKQMLQRAVEANDMHAGEVYGEKAILATEARELQSRLLNLSEERDESLAILDEMQQALETRLAAAEEVRKEAEQEKLEKEESARKVLAEQELIMGKVLAEAERIQQEAKENAKLREFLVDRGHVVDVLQGEIAVICKDVKLLKENFDYRLPVSKSLSSSQTSCILASSSSSGKIALSDLIREHIESSSAIPERTSRPSSVDCASQKSNSDVASLISSSEVVAKVDGKLLADDEWEFCDEYTKSQ